MLPNLRVGKPICHELITVFPLFSTPVANGVPSARTVEYRLANEAIADESLLIEEVSEDGTVSELLVTNSGEQRVLFLEGEELIGAKQNRVLNTSVLVAARSNLNIPVSCVEEGRWNRKTDCFFFEFSGSQTPPRLRRKLKSSVSRSIRETQSYSSAQNLVWEEVAMMDCEYSVGSPTQAMSDMFDACEEFILLSKEELPYVDGATGIAIAVGNKVLKLDAFDKATTCEAVWDRLLSAAVLEALNVGETKERPSTSVIEELIRVMKAQPCETVPAVGEGDEFRSVSARGDYASALAFDKTFVHGSIVAAA